MPTSGPSPSFANGSPTLAAQTKLNHVRDSTSGGGVTKDDRDDLAAIDRSIERMRTLTPAHPYKLTIPQDDEARFRYTWQFQARQWLENTPFDASEHESIQYQTFIYRDPARDVYLQHSMRPKEEANGTPAFAGRSGAGTPSAAPKKTISFGAYKKKQAGETLTDDERLLKPKTADRLQGGQLDGATAPTSDPAAEKKPAAKSPAERLKADTEMLAAVEDGAIDSLIEPEDVVHPTTNSLKRKGDTQSEEVSKHRDSDPQPAVQGHKDVEQPTTKKLKMGDRVGSTEEMRDTLAAQVDSARNSGSAQHFTPAESAGLDSPSPSHEPDDTTIPPRLSPLHESMKSSALPSCLSPSLPDNIIAALDARAKLPPSTNKSTGGKPTTAGDGERGEQLGSPVTRNGLRTTSEDTSARTDARERGQVPITKSSRHPDAPESSPEEEVDSAPDSRTKFDNRKPRQMIVKLEFSKRFRERVRKIFERRPKPDFAAAHEFDAPGKGDMGPADLGQDKPRQRRASANRAVVTNVGSKSTSKQPAEVEHGKSTLPEKRSRLVDPDDAGPAAKRKKPPTTPDRETIVKEPTTPSYADGPSPSAKPSSQSHNTPSMRKDALSASMRREISNQSSYTPSARGSSPSANSLAPAPSSLATHLAPSRPSDKTPLQQAWEAEQRRLEVLGRELKHASAAHQEAHRVDSPPASSEAAKLGAISAVESLLTYMLAFTAADEALRAASPPSQSARPWRSLLAYHSFVRKAAEPFPPLRGLAAGLALAYQARLLELARAAAAPDPALVAECAGLLLRSAADADALLDADVLAARFPRAWAGRTRGPLPASAAAEKLRPGAWEGAYKLPVGAQTTPVRAARAGVAILHEWIASEGVEYAPRLTLSGAT